MKKRQPKGRVVANAPPRRKPRGRTVPTNTAALRGRNKVRR